jgi:hypothetical protein
MRLIAPAEIDLVPDAAVKETTMLGIFKLDGDTLTLVYAAGERPKKFESPGFTQTWLIVLKRAK